MLFKLNSINIMLFYFILEKKLSKFNKNYYNTSRLGSKINNMFYKHMIYVNEIINE